jgi:hypothetical protein
VPHVEQPPGELLGGAGEVLVIACQQDARHRFAHATALIASVASFSRFTQPQDVEDLLARGNGEVAVNVVRSPDEDHVGLGEKRLG